MSEETQGQEQMPTELELLKDRADLMGIEYRPNIGVDKLRARIDAHLKGENADDLEEQASTDYAPQKGYVQTAADISTNKRREATKLVRIRLTNMNPVNASVPAVIPSVGNSVVGMIKKAVPFNVPWHVPQIMLDYFRTKKFMSHYEVPDPRNPKKKIKRTRQVPEFGVEILDPLSEKELHELKQRQLMARGGMED